MSHTLYALVITYSLIKVGRPSDISISENISAPLGSNRSELVCTFVRPNTLDEVVFMHFNDSNVIAKFVIIFGSWKKNITTEGQYLKGRVILEGVTDLIGSTSQAKMIFTDLQCIDGGKYWCQIKWYVAIEEKYLTSDYTTIRTTVLPENPVSIVYSKNQQDNETTTNSTPTEDVSNTTSSRDSATTVSSWSTPQTSENSTGNSENILKAGDSLTVSCSGNVGRPPEPLLVQKVRKDGSFLNTTALVYATEEMRENCSYFYKSTFSTELTDEDNGAFFRCGVQSRITEQNMYIETDPIDVKYPVHRPSIVKKEVQPPDLSVEIFCISDGNPPPSYQWYKQDNGGLVPHESRQNITIYNITDPKTYVCKVKNAIQEVVYTNETKIVVEAQGATQSFTWISSSTEKFSTIVNTLSTTSIGPSVNFNLHDSGNNNTAITVLGIVCGVLSIIIICGAVLYLIQRKRLKLYESGNQLSTIVQYDSVSDDRTAHHYDDLQRRREHDYNNTTFSMHNT